MRMSITFRVFITGLIFFSLNTARAQNTYVASGDLSLKTKQMSIVPGGLVSNVVRVINSTKKKSEFTLSINTPAGFQMIGQQIKTLQLEPNDTLFLPIRVLFSSEILTEKAQTILISLHHSRRIIATENWVITPLLKSAWSASVSENKIVLPIEKEKVPFKLKVINSGMLKEAFTINAALPENICFISESGEVIDQELVKFHLRPFADTTIHYWIKFQNSESALSETEQKPKEYKIRMKVISDGHLNTNHKSWSTNIDIKRLSETFKENQSPRLTLPLVIEFKAYDMMNDNPYGALSLYGSKNFRNERFLSYYMQTNFTNRFIKPNSYLPQYFNVNYKSKFYGAEIGRINQNNGGASIGGQGGRLWGSYGKHTLAVLYLESPFQHVAKKTFDAMGAEYHYSSKKLEGEAYFQAKDNISRKVKSEFFGGNVSYKFLKTHSIMLSGTMSNELHAWKPDSAFSTSGFGYKINYNGSYSKFRYSFSYNNSSPTHIAMRGAKNITTRGSYRINPNNNVIVSYSQYGSKPQYYAQGELISRNFNQQQDFYRIGYQFRGDMADVGVEPIHQISAFDLFKSRATGINLDYRLKDFQGFKFSTNIYAGYTSIVPSNDAALFVGRIRNSLRFQQYSLQLRYYYGPSYYQELLNYRENNILSNRFGASFNFTQPLLHNRLIIEFSSIYNYSTHNKQSILTARPELFYYLQSNIRLGVYTRYSSTSFQMDHATIENDAEIPKDNYTTGRAEFGFSLKIDLNAPISRRRYFDLSIVTFKDLEGTGTMELGDPGIGNIWVRLEKIDDLANNEAIVVKSGQVLEAITDKNGKAVFSNIQIGNYRVSMTPIGNAGSRFETRVYEVLVTGNQTEYYSMDRGAKAVGRLVLDRAQYSLAKHFPLSGIRVTAKRTDGQEFNTLTDENGNYNLFLPKGQYIISINEAIFGAKFELMNNNVSIDIIHEQETVYINFTATEQARKIKIQKPLNNNSPNSKEEK